mgnify:CR=1 FL=1
MTKLSAKGKLPSHVGIIMDGNRRWAKNHGLPAASGHSRGAEVFKNIAKYCNKVGFEHLTVFAFSTENWKRSAEEVSALMFLFKKYLKNVMRDFKSENMQIKFLGDISKFSSDIKDLISTIEQETSGRSGLKLNIAMNYGSRDEIANAAKILAQKALKGELNPESITEETLSENLYTKGQPDIDLIIRTAGEKRLSNFMLWQSAYAEFHWADALWPDFCEDDFNKAIDEYFNRARRFGGE